jgi:hypothetical protein
LRHFPASLLSRSSLPRRYPDSLQCVTCSLALAIAPWTRLDCPPLHPSQIHQPPTSAFRSPAGNSRASAAIAPLPSRVIPLQQTHLGGNYKLQITIPSHNYLGRLAIFRSRRSCAANTWIHTRYAERKALRADARRHLRISRSKLEGLSCRSFLPGYTLENQLNFCSIIRGC